MYADNVRLLQPTILVARVCGVCPSALRKVWIPMSNKVYAAVLALMTIVVLPTTISKYYDNFNDITAFIFICHLVTDCVRILTSLVMPFVFSEELVRFFVVMESVQRSLFSLNIRQPPHPSKRLQLLWIAFTFIVGTLPLVLVLRQGFLYLFHALPYVLVLTGSFVKMRVLLDLVHEKFSLLTWHLDDLNDRWPLFLTRPADVSFREFSSVAKLRRTKFVLPSRDDRAVTAEKINEFNKAHLKLIYACKTLQRIFSLEWFVLSISTALQFIVYIFLASLNEDRLSTAVAICFLFHAVWILVVNLTLTTKIKEKSEKVAILVHILLDEDRHPADVVEELEQFSLSLLHRKANFSAAGFFDFDLKLVSKMASLLAPIVLFLVQNKNRPRAGRRKHNLATVAPKQ